MAPRPQLLLIDNFDSFTHNLRHFLVVAGAHVTVRRNDALSVAAALSPKFDGIVISPGPGTPDDAGISLAVVAACVGQERPLLGVCLGHQAIGQHFGGKVVRGGLMHGKTAAVIHDGSGLFANLPSPFVATRYHSLVLDHVAAPLTVNGHSDAGEIMGLRHLALPIHGVQFHPESVATEQGHALLANFVAICRDTMSRED
ncbi:MAG: aminodeoxychorismate/anthranilate synthase component II [Sphingomonadales bacterium]|nr:aminodeoxychorismate/anthranilate synthase component II [Sphingomonadales bacterium]